MKLRKDTWKIKPLGDICKVLRGDIITKKTIVEGSIPVVSSAVGPSYFHNISNRSADIITITCSGNAGYVDFYKTPIYASDCITVEPLDRKLSDVNFFYYLLKGYEKKIMSFQRGTAQKHIYPKDIIPLKIPIPSLDEQIKIATLFQSIAKVIEQIKEQQKNLLKLKKRLSRGLVRKEPQFGNLLNKENYIITNFGGIADCIEQHDKVKKEVSRFVGLENIEPENFIMTTWGNISEGTTFTKRFSKGDVLFGKRRAYLKKVAVADFDGICSGDILVLRAKEKTMLKELLPFYVSAEVFIKHAINTSAGSLSPRTKWKDLSKFEISIPDLKMQERILEIFHHIETTLDELKTQVKSLHNLKQKLLNEILG